VVVSAGMLGYALGGRSRVQAGLLILLITLVLTLIVDLNRPTEGMVVESQTAMEELRQTMAAAPPEVFERFKAGTPPAK
jgi:hypothetical protein